LSKLPIYAEEKDVEKLKNLLTTDNIKSFAGIIETSRLGKEKAETWCKSSAMRP
jgi:hypothetical protein